MREAQDKGYAEADPGLDVDGHDAAHKLVVLAMLAFGARVDAALRAHRGHPRHRSPSTTASPSRFGYTIKHLAIGRDQGEAIELRVHPALVRARHARWPTSTACSTPIALEGRALGPCMLSGRGAGDLPTAVSVVADVLDVARARR